MGDDMDTDDFQLLGKRCSKRRTETFREKTKKQCSMIDLHIPVGESIVISPASPARGTPIRHKSTPDTTDPLLRDPVSFEGQAVYRGQLIKLSLDQLLNSSDRWIMVVFFPQHFTFSDPSRFIPFFQKNLVTCCDVIATSHDSEFALQAWYNQYCARCWENYDTEHMFLLSDLNHKIVKEFSKINQKLDTVTSADVVSIVILDTNGVSRFCFTDFSPTGPR